MSTVLYTGARLHGPIAGAGQTPKERTELLIDALRRRARVDWDARGVDPGFGMLRLPGTGHEMIVSPAEVTGAYRRIVREFLS